MKAGIALAAWLSFSLFASATGAHTTSIGLATFAVSGSMVSYRLTLVPSELPADARRLFILAADGDQASLDRVADELRRRVTVRTGGGACRAGRMAVQGSRLDDGPLTIETSFHCSGATARLEIRDDWFELFGEHYRTLARIETPSGVREAAFMPDAREVTIDLGPSPSWPGGHFFRLGIEHILGGYDHLLFLAALLLRGGTLLSLLKIVTAFTLAHSLTLTLAVLGLVTIPARVVEPVIAASIAWVAFENLALRNAPSRRWLVSLLFGLVHGLGFASALEPLALPRRNLVLALLGFNLGVEAGQALVVVLLVPILFWMRRFSWDAWLVRAASVGLMIVGFVWFVERLFFT